LFYLRNKYDASASCRPYRARSYSMNIRAKATKNIVNDAIIKEISDAVETLGYGTVTVKVHDRKITQVEVAEKKRFDDVWKIEEGGGI